MILLLWHDYIYIAMLPVYETVIPVKDFTDQPTPQKVQNGLFINKLNNNVSNFSVDQKTIRILKSSLPYVISHVENRSPPWLQMLIID